MLNERTYAATQERSARVEALVSEMRSDLKSLKSRLDDEIRELGISERQAENLLTSFYLSLDSRLSGQASPPKRPRKHQSQVDVNDDDEMDEEVVGNASTDRGSTKQ
jgi:signal-transduction protein with cAMP-binding, CBS, and nucleotidyltransferase domain